MRKSVIIVGAGGHGKVIADIVEKRGDAVLGFLDDKPPEELIEFHIVGRVSDMAELAAQQDVSFAMGIGSNRSRKRIMEQYDVPWYTPIHPSAVIGNHVDIGAGTAIMANAVINSGSRIGRGAVINTAATVDHDNVIGDYVHISPGAHLAGMVSVGEGTWIGIGACVKNNLTICGDCVIGAGATVVNNILSGGGGSLLAPPLKNLIIIGASGFGKEVAWLVERINIVSPTWNIIGYLDDNASLHGTRLGGYPILGDCAKASAYTQAYFVCAIGSATIRRAVVSRLESVVPSPLYATLIDPSVMISSRVEIGVGSVICAGSILTVDIKIGRHVIVNLDCTIGHDAVISDYVTLYPSVNVSGLVSIGACVELGTGVQVIQGKTIGSEAIVGAGAVVVRDLPERCTAVGSPARVIKFHEEVSACKR